MSQTEWIEASCDALIEKLEAGLPAAIEAINAEAASDGFIIEPPTRIVFGERSETTYPWVMVAPSRTSPDLDTGEHLLYVHSIDIVSVYHDLDEDILPRKLVRFGRAVRQVALANRRPGVTDGLGGWSLRFGGDNYGPMSIPPGDTGGAIKAVTTTVLVKQQQNV